MSHGDPCLPERDGRAEERETYPWGFKVTIALTALYLLWRLIQGIGWLISRLFG